MDRVERLADLTAHLLGARRALRVYEIVVDVPGYPEEDESARVTFNRDKAVLLDEGIPVETTEYEGDPAYRIDPERYYLPDLGLTAEEKLALNVALSDVALQGADPWTAGWKLGSSPATVGPLVSLDSSPWLPVLNDAVQRRATVRFTYKGVDREVEPYGLLAREGWWYVVGFDRRRDGRRVFRVDRIEGDVKAGAGGEFDVPGGFDLRHAIPEELWQLGQESPVDVDVWVDRAHAERVVRDVGEARVVEEREDGSVVVRVSVTSPPGFRSWLFGMLDHARVLGPPEMVEEIVGHLRAMAQ